MHWSGFPEASRSFHLQQWPAVHRPRLQRVHLDLRHDSCADLNLLSAVVKNRVCPPRHAAIPRGGAPSSTTNIAQSFRDLTRALIINWRLLTSALRSAKSAFLSTLMARVGGPCCDLVPPLFSGASDECAISSENRAPFFVNPEDRGTCGFKHSGAMLDSRRG